MRRTGGHVDERICELARAYAREVYEEELELLRRLARIPAPSHHEERRAAFIREWLVEQGAPRTPSASTGPTT